MNLLAEPRRRNVVRIAGLCLVGASRAAQVMRLQQGEMRLQDAYPAGISRP